MAALSREELAKYRLHSVGMVFQSFNLIPSMSLFENVELPLRFAEVDRSERSTLARQSLERVGLSGRLAHRPMELSGGEQQRAWLARALINRPKLLLADEPTGNLDSRTGTEIMELIRSFNQSLGMTVLMVTHEQALAEKYAGRMLHLADGRLVDDSSQPFVVAGARAAGRNAMKFHDVAELGVRNLRESILRNSLTTLGIAVGVASLVAMLSLGIGLQQLANRRLSRPDSSTPSSSLPSVTSRTFREQREDVPPPAESRVTRHTAAIEISKVSDVIEASPEIRFMTEVRYANEPSVAA